MDVIIWKDVSMALNSTESRFFFIQENILSDAKLQEISEENQYCFSTPKKYDCSEEGFKTVYNENTPFLKDGKTVIWSYCFEAFLNRIFICPERSGIF